MKNEYTAVARYAKELSDEMRDILIQKRLVECQSAADELRDALNRAGFVQCDIPECNCGGWHHRYGLPERWEEVKEALSDAGYPLNNENGHLVLNALKALIAERDTLRSLLNEDLLR